MRFTGSDAKDSGSSITYLTALGDVDEPFEGEVKHHVGVFTGGDWAIGEAQCAALTLGYLGGYGIATVLRNLYLEHVCIKVLSGGEASPNELTWTFCVRY
ncbi:hypothetical protein KY092_08765 [Natronomonas gomsonensis]|uniref:hypothetical protein n=1 Tax=Natronomonas gomsonensis TaxID=1046043 RepID=UPI0020CA7FF6|nr:hypothetical protein [Natronomonas gomsonensis]MCY4730648.1 hypothetical protein [Natronomonas gomsonensis]